MVTIQEALRQRCEHQPNDTFIWHGNDSYTYREVARTASCFAGFLRSSGVNKGDKVCVALPRVPELIISFIGSTLLGAVPVPANYTLCPKDFNSFLLHVRPSVLIIHEDYKSSIEEGIIADPHIIKIIVGAEEPGFVSWSEVCEATELAIDHRAEPDDICYLNYTTGSSGQPKGAIAKHRNLYWNTRAAIETFNLSAMDVHLCMFASFAHPHEIFYRALFTGGSTVLLKEVNPTTIIKTIARFKVTCVMGLAPMYSMMANHYKGGRIKSLRIVESGGMYTDSEISKKFREVFHLPILSVWGSTETSGIALANTQTNYKEDGSMGMPCPYYDVKIVDENGNEVPAGEIGELVLRSKAVVDGYQDSDSCSVVNGWYHSGDLARVDENGFFYFIERKNNMIKVAGLKVFPLQIESVLAKHPDILEVAVIGVEERRHGMVPKAFIVARENKPITSDDVRAFLRGKIANYMIPKIVEAVPALPVIGSGKINKKILYALEKKRAAELIEKTELATEMEKINLAL